MDENKLTKLRDIRYEIPKTCGLCKHGVFYRGKDMGACAVRTYEHLKHTGEPRQLSIYRGGACHDKYEASEEKIAALGAFAEFVTTLVCPFCEGSGYEDDDFKSYPCRCTEGWREV